MGRSIHRGILLLATVCALGVATAVLAESELVGDSTCLACHEGLQEKYSHTIHFRVLQEGGAPKALADRGCEACHGPGREHLEAGGGIGVGGFLSFRGASPEAIALENGACLACHSGGERVHWSGSAHESRDVACTSCHVVMENRSEQGQLAARTELETCATCHVTRRAQLFRNAHMPLREGAMSCDSCHNPHGTVVEALVRHDTVNDGCYQCHAGKRGPFLWEHAPVTENCLNCHDPHGSPREKMLTLSPPRLCQQCHIETLHPTEARSPSNKFVIGSACVQCHSKVHGSNHPSGFGLTR